MNALVHIIGALVYQAAGHAETPYQRAIRLAPRDRKTNRRNRTK